MNYADNLKKKRQKDSKRSQWRDIITPTLYTIKKTSGRVFVTFSDSSVSR